MIIECPQCGFTGRVPHRVTLAPHQARCPKCRLRFDIGDPDLQIPDVAGRNGAELVGRDPGDSSYELDPINVGVDGVWAVDRKDHDGVAPAPYPTPSPAARSLQERAALVLQPSVLRIRLFQAWAVFFLVWAGYIVVRTTVAALGADDARFFSNDLLRPVAAVVVLVSAAALLCLSVDVSRRLTRLTYASPPPPAPPATSPPPTSSAEGRAMAHHRPGGDLARRPDDRGD